MANQVFEAKFISEGRHGPMVVVPAFKGVTRHLHGRWGYHPDPRAIPARKAADAGLASARASFNRAEEGLARAKEAQLEKREGARRRVAFAKQDLEAANTALTAAAKNREEVYEAFPEMVEFSFI